MKLVVFILFIFSVHTITYGQALPDTIPMNRIRILASHNSYKRKPNPRVLDFLKRFESKLGPENNPDFIDYGHLSFKKQFNDYGIRGIELDVNYDPKGGHYKRRRVNLFLFGQKQRIKDKTLKEPGFKLLHISDVDFETNYLTFNSALLELRSWSEAHPNHLPIYINIEAKGSHLGDESRTLQRLGFKKCIPFNTNAYKELESEIRAVFTEDQVFSPSDFKIGYSTLRERINTEGWPLLTQIKGKFIFILEGNNNHLYKSFLNPLMFQYGTQDDENTIFLLRNNAVSSEVDIQKLSQSFMVRTRSDAGTVESRANSYQTWEAAKRSGAQIISTDYYMEDSRWSSYKVGFLNGLFEILKP